MLVFDWNTLVALKGYGDNDNDDNRNNNNYCCKSNNNENNDKNNNNNNNNNNIQKTQARTKFQSVKLW